MREVRKTKFVEFTTVMGNKVYMNTDNIACVMPDGETQTRVWFVGGDADNHIVIDKPYSEVKNTIFYANK